jgi:hypothetical protein
MLRSGIACLLCGVSAAGCIIACARNDPPGSHASAPPTPRSVAEGSTSTLQRVINGATRPPDSTGSPPIRGSAQTRPALIELAAPSDAPQQYKESELRGADGQPLPQTDERPNSDSKQFQHRIQLLCEAIIEGIPSKAHAAFFPLIAYAQVKAVADPERDYRTRLLAHFDRDIREYHEQVKKRAGPLRCAGVSSPESLARWMKPGSEYNRIGYFRLLRSNLRMVDAAGNSISLRITSLISWRGQWYVVHLNGFE